MPDEIIDQEQGQDQGQDQSQDQGNESQDWKAGLSDELKAEKSLESFKDVGGLAKSYVESQKMIGGSIRIPGEGATPDEIAAFHTKLGRPETVEGYEFVKPDLPEGVQWDDKLVGWFGLTAHSLGISKAQAQGIMQAWNDNQFEQGHEAQKSMKAGLDNLKESWGEQYPGNIELGVRGIERLLPANEAKEFKALMDSSGVGNNPLMLKYAHQIGKLLKADGYIIGDGHGGVLGVESAKAKIKEINADLKHPHWNPDTPGHKEAVDEMANLFKTAYPK